MIRQVFLFETSANGFRNVLAHGWHPDVANGRQDADPPETEDDTHPVTTASVSGQAMRVVFDEILYGNSLEEIECRDTTFSRVPLGTTPDDIANCAVAADLLPALCKGEHAVCLNPAGVPVGVVDDDEDGAADNTRMIAGAVTLRCGTFEVELNREQSFWQPAGTQLVPAGQTPGTSIGPALIIAPEGGRMPSKQTDCRLAFAPDVTDKDFIQPCVPTGGEEDTDNYGDCTGGDLSAFHFGTESIVLSGSLPTNNSPAVAVTRRALQMTLSAEFDMSSVAGATATVMEGATARTDFTLTSTVPRRVDVTMAANLVANTMYTITVTNLKDTFGVVLDPIVLQFTTAP
ncbi:MAG: Ig-like domain-containing protein [Myxococcales bacterium]|nr:Ig-like domain-containing protein [Myxococcales bacterium]